MNTSTNILRAPEISIVQLWFKLLSFPKAIILSRTFCPFSISHTSHFMVLHLFHCSWAKTAGADLDEKGNMEHLWQGLPHFLLRSICESNWNCNRNVRWYVQFRQLICANKGVPFGQSFVYLSRENIIHVTKLEVGRFSRTSLTKAACKKQLKPMELKLQTAFEAFSMLHPLSLLSPREGSLKWGCCIPMVLNSFMCKIGDGNVKNAISTTQTWKRFKGRCAGDVVNWIPSTTFVNSKRFRDYLRTIRNSLYL